MTWNIYLTVWRERLRSEGNKVQKKFIVVKDEFLAKYMFLTVQTIKEWIGQVIPGIYNEYKYVSTTYLLKRRLHVSTQH